IICGVGSDEILTFLCQAYAGVGDEVIHTEHGFSMYPILARAAGATPVEVPEKNRVVDVDAILAAVTKRTRLVFVTNPGNPTGTRITDEELSYLADSLPSDIVLVIDGAYAEYVEGYGETFDGGAALAGARDNVVMTRTFSKLYGLGGLRVGWGYAGRGIIDVLNRVRGPFNLSAPALAASEAAMRDRGFAERCIAENARLRAEMVHAIRSIGLGCDASEANFVLARFGSAAEAEGCEAALKADGILVRKVGGYGFPEGLRITVGDEAGVARVLSTMQAYTASRAA
ncbi:MAG: histidinol-phosphate transaminase, partial [Pseudomonadota bacterium]